MNKVGLLFLPLLLTTCYLLLAPLTLAQSPFNQGEVVTLSKDQVINQDYFATGEKVVVSGTVNGDAYLAGGSITVDGVINGDLLVAGGDLNLKGQVTGNIRAAGGSIIVSSSIGRNATITGGEITLTEGALVTGNSVIAGGSVDINAPISSNLTVAGGNIILASRVGKDINASAGELTLTKTATVSGNLSYWSKTLAQLEPGATVSGQVTKYTPTRDSEEFSEGAKNALNGLGTLFKLAGFISSLVIGLLLIKFLPGFTMMVHQNITKSPIKSFLIGLLVLIITPIIVFALIITLFGFPLGLILLFLYILILYLSKIFISFTLGNLIFEKLGQKTNPYLTFFFGLLVFYILSLIPVLGTILTFVGMMVSVGALLLTKKDYYSLLSKNPPLKR